MNCLVILFKNCELIILDALDNSPSLTPHLLAVSSPATILLITSAEYRSVKGAFLSTPTGNLLQACVNALGSLELPLLTGNLPSGAIDKVLVYPSSIE